MGWVSTRDKGEHKGDSVVVVAIRHCSVIIVLSCCALHHLSLFVTACHQLRLRWGQGEGKDEDKTRDSTMHTHACIMLFLVVVVG